jgi:spermidine synthase
VSERSGVPRAGLLVALFAASGCAALVLETVWLRWLRLLFGATAPAVSATLVAFLVGQALGAALAARRVPSLRRPLRVYGVLELSTALWALAVPLLLGLGEQVSGAFYDGWRDAPAALTALRFSIALAATLPATLCLGATLPAVGAAALATSRALGSGGTALYAANLLGAALGAGAAAFWLLDAYGVPPVYAGAAALHGAVGAVAVVLGGRVGAPAPPRPAAPPPAPRAAEDPGLGLLPLAALSGFGTFAGQVLLVQAFAQILDQSVHAFGAVLVVVLAALALGAAAVSWLDRRGALAPSTLLGIALAGSAVGFAAFPALLSWASDGLQYVGSESPWPGYLLRALALSAATAGPALVAAGLVFPALFGVAGRSTLGRAPAEHLGWLVAANTVGSIAGALLAPFALLPAAGLWPSFAGIAGLYAVAALAAPDVSPRARALRAGVLAAALAGVALALNPLAIPLLRLAPGERALYVETGPSGVVAVIERAGERLVRTDNHYSLGGSSERVNEERQGHLPLLLQPEAERVAFVGTATAITAGAAVVHPVREIFLVEIVPGVAESAARFFAPWNRNVARDPRTRTVVDDARNFLRSTKLSFDVVVADLFVPWRAGSGSLYAREHFESVRARLRPGGVLCQWLPLYQLAEDELRVVVATFLDVFPRAALFRGDFYARFPIVALVGYAGAPAPPRLVSRAAVRLGRSDVADRWVTDPVAVWSLYAGPLAPLAPSLADVPRNSDAHPRIEFMAARSHAGGVWGKPDSVTGRRWLHFDKALREAAARSGDPVYPDLPPQARRASLGGALLQAAAVFYSEDRSDDAAQALAAAAEHLPRRVFAGAPPDPTAAEVWTDAP